MALHAEPPKPSTCSTRDFSSYEEKYYDNFYTKAISREQQNAKGGRMYIQTGSSSTTRSSR